nr:uncharacterized protein LOC113829163 isoform X3 [Penaeus vannamei]
MLSKHGSEHPEWYQLLATERERKRNNLEKITGITFCGCGFLGIYLVGAAAYIQEHHPSLLSRQLAGSSFGSIVAACVACGVPLQHIRRILITEVKRIRKTFLGPLNPNYRLEEPLMNALLEVLPADAHIRASGRVFLSLTSVSTFASEVVSRYPSRDELIRAILCCCFLPYLSGFSAPSFKGRRYMDGGFSNIKPLEGPSIITINAFSGNFDICPQDPSGEQRPLNPFFGLCVAMSQENLFRLKWGVLPPEPEVLDQFFHFGYFHARTFLSPDGPKVPRLVECKVEESEESKADCLVHDVGGATGTTKTPSVFVKNSAVLSILYGEGLPSRTSAEGDAAFEVHLQTGNKTFVLAFGEHGLQVSQQGQGSDETRDFGDAVFPLDLRRGVWQMIGVGVTGGWLTVMDPLLPDLVFQRRLGEGVGGATRVHVVSQMQLAVIFNCEAGCPVLTSPSLTAQHLQVASSRAFYVFPITSRYVVSLEVEVARAGGGGGEAERLRLEVHRGGMARLREWNKVQVILEPGSHENLVILEINGEVSSNDAVRGSLESVHVSLEEISDARFAARCRPASPRKERKVTSYHHYEEVERVVAEAVFRSRPLCSVPEESVSEPPDVDLAVGGEQLYQNIPGSCKR